jgi:hypothetical protein
LNNKDALLAAKYENDTKFARIHKRIKENNLNVVRFINTTLVNEFFFQRAI